MQKAVVLMLAVSGLLSACSPGAYSWQRDFYDSRNQRNEGMMYRGVIGDFCPPAQAMKGNC